MGIDMSKVMEKKSGVSDDGVSDGGYRFYTGSGKRVTEEKRKDVDDMDDEEFLERSKEDFHEWIEESGDDQVQMITKSGEVVKTSSRACGDGEYLFLHDGKGYIRIWKGFEDMSSSDFVFNHPDISITFDPDRGVGRPTVITSIQEFELDVVFSIYDFYRSMYEKQSMADSSVPMDDLDEEERKIVNEEVPSKEEFQQMSKEEKAELQKTINEKLMDHRESKKKS